MYNRNHQQSNGQNLAPVDLMLGQYGSLPTPTQNDHLSISKEAFCGSETNLFKTPLPPSSTENEPLRRQIEAIKRCFLMRLLKDSNESIAVAYTCAALDSDPAFVSSILKAAANSVAMHGYPLYPCDGAKPMLTASLPVRGRYRHNPYDTLKYHQPAAHYSAYTIPPPMPANPTGSADRAVLYPSMDSVTSPDEDYANNTPITPPLDQQSSSSPPFSTLPLSTTELLNPSANSAAITATNDVQRPPSHLTPPPETTLPLQFKPKLFRPYITEA